MFAECRSSDTRQNQSLPSASDETLGKHNFAECLKKYTRQTSSRALHAPVTVGWRSSRYYLLSAGYGTLGKPSFVECLTVNTRQTMSRAPHTTVTTTVTPLPRLVPVTTSVTVTSCRVRGVGHSATFCQCRVHYAGTRHLATFAKCSPSFTRDLRCTQASTQSRKRNKGFIIELESETIKMWR